MSTMMKLFFRMYILPAFGNFVANSSQIITDLGTAISTTPSATAQAAATAAAGPNTDLTGVLNLVQLKAKEMRELLNYVLSGKQIVPASLTAPTGGIITSGSDSTIYNALVSVFQILQ